MMTVTEEELHFRHELKYDIGLSEYYQLIPRIRAVMKQDENVGSDGIYRIQSIYFDNYRDKALREKTVGIQKREKFRIRWYNDDIGCIKLEKKMKINDLCLKYSAAITETELIQILEGDTEWMILSEDPLIRELYMKEKTQQLKPRVIVSYEREPYIYEAGNVRVTFDSDIRSSLYHPLSGLNPASLIDARMEPGRMIMEVKYDAYLPAVISDLLQIGYIRQNAFSKYGICRRFG